MSRPRPVRVVYITKWTALVRGVPAEQLRTLGVDRRMWCDPISTWAVPSDVVTSIKEWAASNGHRVTVEHAEVDR